MVGLFLLSASTLLFEINLSRLFSVAQFYHFAFLIVSIALLGSGAGGTALAMLPPSSRLRQPEVARKLLFPVALATAVSILASYLLVNYLPFDSFLVALKPAQLGILALHYLALALPFFFSGIAVGMLLNANPKKAGSTYAVNLFGAAMGCAAALLAPHFLGIEGVLVLSSLLALIAALTWAQNWLTRLSIAILLLLLLPDPGLRLAGTNGYPFLELHLSPYKGLSYLMQVPDVQTIEQRWNAFSRLDLVRSTSIHSLPGLSYRYMGALPAQDGLLTDGDDLSPVIQAGEKLDFVDQLPTALAFQLQPNANTLVLEPRGGLDVSTALTLGARQVAAVEANPDIISLVPQVYQAANVLTVNESGRSFLQRSSDFYDIIIYSLANSFHPIRSGAYSLAEDYRYTVESFRSALEHLAPQGILLVTRWLQTPPSEDLRTFGLALTALGHLGVDPNTRIVALRSYNTITFLIKKEPFTISEMAAVRSFAKENAFDLVFAPDLQPDEINQFNILQEPIYEQVFANLINSQPTEAFYQTYPYDVCPPTDDHPFFGHYFKWSQARQIWAEMGRTWQPFGGAGYFVILALFGLALLCAAILVILPALSRRREKASRPVILLLIFFGCIGLAFMLVEIPLIQRFILYLGHPAYAMTAVLFSLLLFSGLGSAWSNRIPASISLLILVGLLLSLTWLLPAILNASLGLAIGWRLFLTVIFLAPVGFLMGICFPAGIRRLGDIQSRSHLSAANPEVSTHESTTPWIGWAWAVNGAASVVASILAALLALSFGFRMVFIMGAVIYALAWVVFTGARRGVKN
jgi:hypothetical protein